MLEKNANRKAAESAEDFSKICLIRPIRPIPPFLRSLPPENAIDSRMIPVHTRTWPISANARP